MKVVNLISDVSYWGYKFWIIFLFIGTSKDIFGQLLRNLRWRKLLEVSIWQMMQFKNQYKTMINTKVQTSYPILIWKNIFIVLLEFHFPRKFCPKWKKLQEMFVKPEIRLEDPLTQCFFNYLGWILSLIKKEFPIYWK